MGFFKKLFAGIGFAAGFLFYGCLSMILYASRGRHKPCHRRSGFWNTLERYLIFSWICDGVRSSRKRAEKSYYRRTGGDFWQTQKQARPESVKNAVPAVKTPRPESKSTSTGATRSVKPKRTERPSAAQKASAAQSSVQNVLVPTMTGHSVSEADAGKHSERSKPMSFHGAASRKTCRNRCTAMYQKWKENSAATARKNSATVKAAGWSWNCILAGRMDTAPESCTENGEKR